MITSIMVVEKTFDDANPIMCPCAIYFTVLLLALTLLAPGCQDEVVPYALVLTNLPTTSMEPNYPMGKRVVTSKLVRPGRADVVICLATALPIPGVRPAEEGMYIGRNINCQHP
ncbi:MAG: hypothetical protein KDC12_15535 [Flavobacteriales bacterium]|nr:hypothetical protein [Flavobacteriales bacterium]